jgi:hypothetical protein
MRRFNFCSGIVVLLCGSLSSAEPDAALDRALGLVNEALQAEVTGDLLCRERLLTESQHAAPQCGPTNWFNGRVLIGEDKWATVDESIELAKSDTQLDNYEAMRAKQPASVYGNWQAAQWCAKQGMAAQCRAHLENILVLEHDHEAARKLLGHHLVGNDWLTPQDQWRLAQRAQFIQAGFAKYQKQVADVLTRIRHTNAAVQEKAWEQLKAIVDPQAIPVMEAAAVQLGGSSALAVVDWLSGIDHQESALALSRLAITTAEENVQQAALKHLKEKPLYDFVPELMGAMSSPIMYTTVPVMNKRGDFLGFRQTFAQEGADDLRLLKLDTSVTHQAVGIAKPVATSKPFATVELLSEDRAQPFGQRRTYLATTYNTTTVPLEEQLQYEADVAEAALCEAVAKLNVVANLHSRMARAEYENQQISQFNNQVAKLISEVSGEEFVSIPRDVWKWWDRYNKTDYQHSKVQRQRYQSDRMSIPHYYDYAVLPSYSKTDYQIYKASCFVAGTQVSTLRGLRSIETIMPGDMVLSRNVSTGELKYQAVICQTRRAPAPTVILSVDNNETIHATTSHLLWVSGQGWTQAGEIKPGDLLHAAAEPAVVMNTTPSDELPTYNLIVMDTHTYFVGSSRVLSHDVLPRGSVHEVIPGEFKLAANAP